MRKLLVAVLLLLAMPAQAQTVVYEPYVAPAQTYTAPSTTYTQPAYTAPAYTAPSTTYTQPAYVPAPAHTRQPGGIVYNDPLAGAPTTSTEGLPWNPAVPGSLADMK